MTPTDEKPANLLEMQIALGWRTPDLAAAAQALGPLVYSPEEQDRLQRGVDEVKAALDVKLHFSTVKSSREH